MNDWTREMEEEAIAADPPARSSFDDWDAFEAWLVADAAHALTCGATATDLEDC